MSPTLQRAAGNAEQADSSFPLLSCARWGCAFSQFLLHLLTLPCNAQMSRSSAEQRWQWQTPSTVRGAAWSTSLPLPNERSFRSVAPSHRISVQPQESEGSLMLYLHLMVVVLYNNHGSLGFLAIFPLFFLSCRPGSYGPEPAVVRNGFFSSSAPPSSSSSPSM